MSGSKTGTRLFLILVAALVLRGVSYHANRYVMGDVNHFVSVTGTFAAEGTVSLPYRNNIYQANPEPLGPGYREVYAQHQPLWMVLGGLAYRGLGCDDPYAALKDLSLLCGVLLLCLLLFPALRGSRRMALALGFCAVSIAAIDFSANGSFYILCALLYMGFVLSLAKAGDSRNGMRWGLAAGILGVLALLTHLISAALIVAVPVYLLLCRPRNRSPAFLAGGVMVGGLVVYEAAWKLLAHAPLNPSLVNFLVGMGLAERTLDAGNFRFVVDPTVSLSSLPLVLRNSAAGAWGFLMDILVVTGPLVVFLIPGIRAAFKRRREPEIALTLAVLIGQLLVVAVFPFDKLRFAVPVLPLVFLVAALGIQAWPARTRSDGAPPRAVPVLIALFVVYNLFYLARFPHTFYDGSRPSAVRTYLKMEDAATWMAANTECGNVLGYTPLLDGGVETYRFYPCPFVAGRAFLPYPELLPRLVERYGIAYIWTDTTVRADREYLRDLPAVYEGDRFVVLRTNLGQPPGGG